MVIRWRWGRRAAGEEQNDYLYGESGDDDLNGGSGTDYLDGGSGVDKLFGGDGDDFLDGGAGVDTMGGGFGNDTYVIDTRLEMGMISDEGGIDTVMSSVRIALDTFFREGNNILENLKLTEAAGNADAGGSEDANRLEGNSFANSLFGGGGDDQLFGMGGDDLLLGDRGLDYLAGGMGNDTYIVLDNGDTVSEAAGQGIDTVHTHFDHVLGNNIENLVLQTFFTAPINGTGNALDNELTGSPGVNLLSGGDGNDVLDGGAAADTLVGGQGDDVFVFDAADLTPAGNRWFGQSGSDAVRIGTGQSLDLIALGDDRITGIEVIDLRVVGANSVSLASTDVRAISDFATLRVAGSSGDQVIAQGVWGQGADVQIGSDLYHTYAAAGATLHVDVDVGIQFV